MTITLWISNQTWQLQDKLGRSVGLLAEGKKVGSLDQGGNPITYLLTEGITKHITIGFIVILVLYVAAFVYTYVSYKKNKLY